VDWTDRGRIASAAHVSRADLCEVVAGEVDREQSGVLSDDLRHQYGRALGELIAGQQQFE